MQVLVIEDEVRLAASLRRGLAEEGYHVAVAADGETGYHLAKATSFDVLIVDWRLPRRNGQALVRQLRAEGYPAPILMLTALGGIDHRVAGLDAGADDYLTKPFAFEELLARLRALVRRAQATDIGTTWVQQGALALDTRRRRVTCAGRPIDLRPKEFALLEAFLRQPGQVLSRTVLAEQVWGAAFYVTDNVIDVSMSRLRQKLEDAQGTCAAAERVRIETVRGVGYCLVVSHQP